MDEQSHPEKPSQETSPRSAEVLRDLRDRTHEVLERHRKQMHELEQRLNGQLASLSEAIAGQFVNQDQNSVDLQQRDQEGEEFRRKISEVESGWREDREKLDESIKEQQRRFEEREAAWKSDRDTLVAERDQLADAYSKAEEQLRAGQENSREGVANSELEHKFNLAMEDVERLRERVSELEEELSERPDISRRELFELRSNRNTLVERVEELEQQMKTSAGKGTERNQADQQRRFELAVEDVRQLKIENAELEEKLAEAKRAAVSLPAGGSDWESQKRRLLDSLEQEGISADAGRQKEMATISNTIRITDSVVAAKDRDIAEMKEQLAAAGGPSLARSASDSAVVVGDEVVQQHRDRLAQMEKMLEETLRAAELELSIERAKIAREKAQLAQQHLDLEQLRDSVEAANEAASPSGSKPRRRWLAKLGLGEGDDPPADS